LKKLGCEVIDSSRFGADFTCGNFNGNVNDVENVDLSDWQKKGLDWENFFGDKIVVPAGGRMIAMYGTEVDYMYDPQSSYSWAIPMLSGIFTLALQVNPTLTYDEFVTIARSTAIKNSKGLKVINPEGIIDECKQK
jgi:hypothetical protein